VAFDPQGRTAIDWGVTAPPETFILDGDGTVLYRFAGPLIGSDYEQRFLPELNKALGK
jgi:cytochrome c biogenesis protein CcmG/thiol:disulfide interchange protein DsbE